MNTALDVVVMPLFKTARGMWWHNNQLSLALDDFSICHPPLDWAEALDCWVESKRTILKQPSTDP
jgi:hypothetical protein